MKWMTFLIIHFYKYRKNDAVYQKAYGALLKQFARIGIPRSESQTFREYALHIDTLYNSADMQQLTASYENAMYKQEQTAEEWKKSVHLWEVLMKKQLLYLNQMALIQLFNLENVSLKKTSQRTTLFFETFFNKVKLLIILQAPSQSQPLNLPASSAEQNALLLSRLFRLKIS